ncbi:unnamed protein product [Haemonchus placei]|uniref:Peptidase A2 domain-containing protein n=1 Tax=Haemonchus placei TaxID=6290 RepID=A0A0N4X1N8_HAEPC|nr:unnamed protein product [Haemonchus placei]
MKLVELNTSVQKRKEIECWNCGNNHYARHCKSRPWFCKKCRKAVHKEKFCDILRQKKSDFYEEPMKKDSEGESGGSKRASRKEVRTVRSAYAPLEVSSHRMYVNAVVDNCVVKFPFDTGSDITLLNEKSWKNMISLTLQKTDVIVKNASGDQVMVHGKLTREGSQVEVAI